MQLTSGQIEKIFGPSANFDRGLGIVETGSVAGGLSTLFLIGFELLGAAGPQVDSNELAIKCTTLSRLFGGVAEELVRFIPLIPAIERSNVLSLSGRLDALSIDGLYKELGPEGAIRFVRIYLCEFLDAALTHFLSRCSDLSDKSFSRALSAAGLALAELLGTFDAESLVLDAGVFETSTNLLLFQEILDLSWLE